MRLTKKFTSFHAGKKKRTLANGLQRRKMSSLFFMFPKGKNVKCKRLYYVYTVLVLLQNCLFVVIILFAGKWSLNYLGQGPPSPLIKN